MDNFELLHTIQAYENIPISEYKSKKTGLTVFIAKIDGPITTAFLTLANESFDDDAIISTILDRLICMGSQEYPYKEFFPALGRKCLISSTSSFTFMDYVCFVLESAGNEGILTVLPVYIDTILFPELSNAAYITEIHHITEEGEDDGQLYRDIEEIENSAESLLYLAVMKHLYPGRCGYSYAYRGKMKTLRESMNIEKVRQYHREFYRPENLKIILLGTMKHKVVFKSLEKIEEKIVSQGERRPFQRLWQNPMPPMTEDKDIQIFYPANQGTTGLVCMAWRGPSTATELYDLLATSIFLKYLTDFPFSPLKRKFVVDVQYAKNIYNFLKEGVESCIMINFEGVPLNKMSEVKIILQVFFKKIIFDKNIDMEDLKKVMNSVRIKYLNNFESSPHDHLGWKIIHHVLYGNTKDNFQQRVNPVKDIARLLDEPQSYWLNLIQKYFVKNKYVFAQSLPSYEEKQKLVEMEKERIAVQRQKLTYDDLKEKEANCEQAYDYVERPFPPELLNNFPTPSLTSIKFHNVYRYTSWDEENGKIDLSKTPVFTYFDDVKSNFVYMYAILDTRSIPSELVNYLHILKEIMFDLPIQQEESSIHYQDVIKRLDDDTIFRGVIPNVFGFKFILHLEVENSKYENGVRWLSQLLYNTVFTTERLKEAAKRIIDSLEKEKYLVESKVEDIMDKMCYPQNRHVKLSISQKIKFISEFIKKLGTNDGRSKILQSIERMRKIITKPSSVALYFAGNLDCLNNPAKAINEFLPAHVQQVKVQMRLIPIFGFTLLDFTSPINACVFGDKLLKRSLFSQNTKCLITYDNRDYIVLCLYLKYITKMENEKWKTYAMKHLTYGFSIDIDVDLGILKLFYTIKDVDVMEAYTSIKEMIMNQIESRKWDASLLESVRSSYIFDRISEENSFPGIIQKALFSYLYTYDLEQYRNNIKFLKKVTVDDLNRIGKKYLAHLFNPIVSKTAVITEPSKTAQVAKDLKQLGFRVKVFSSVESFIH